MSRPVVAFLFGGASDEHDVSVKSAGEIAAALDTTRWEPVWIGITRSGAWMLCDGPAAGWQDGSLRRAVVSPDRDVHGLLVAEADGVRELRIDAVFPVLHGRGGEDGAVQGLLELSGIPYVGCDIAGSAVCMDKALAYVVAHSAGIPTPSFTIVHDDPVPPAVEYPVFVKPARSGSSFGVRRVDAPGDLPDAVADARRYDRKVLIEGAVVGTEVGCAVMGSGPELLVGEVDMITMEHGFFRIHQEAAPEQGSENAVVTVPAPVPHEVRDRIRSTATAIYRALGCSGLARVDMFLRPDGEVVLNEVNTLPGFTSYSRYPRMMAAAGIGMTELVTRLLDAALAGAPVRVP
ncbi:D-alanine--D-alanine ligase family protein [Pseudolysinimonas sp.]|uniref:D-alanine--D-alanine ligase family protein n=1 Tax=Pseudolysinimonas sp. TaxID=2680009 RepID=UPI003F7EF08B